MWGTEFREWEYGGETGEKVHVDGEGRSLLVRGKMSIEGAGGGQKRSGEKEWGEISVRTG